VLPLQESAAELLPGVGAPSVGAVGGVTAANVVLAPASEAHAMP